MSLITSVSSTPSAASAVNPHGHGHKKGLQQVESLDDSLSDDSSSVPVATQQSLFGSVMQSLQQTANGQSSSVTPVSSTSSVTAGATIGATSTVVAPSASTSLQKYLGNVSQSLAANAAQSAQSAGSAVSVSA